MTLYVGWDPKKPMMPLDFNGNFAHYPLLSNCEWHVIEKPFYAEFEIDGVTSGRSAKYLRIKSLNGGRNATMFVSDLVKGIQIGTLTIRGGVLMGYWTGSKRGSNYGLKTVKP